MPIKLGRLSRQRDFDKIFHQGKLWQNNLFVLRERDNNFGQTRLAVVVSNKVSKKAVARNLLRRRVKEIIRQALAGAVQRRDLIFIAKQKAAGNEFIEIKAAVISLLAKAKIV